MTSTAPNEPGGRPRRWLRWSLRGAAALALAGVVVPALWVGVHAVAQRPLPAARYTEADLPALPPAEQNGWLKAGAIEKIRPPPKELAALVSGAAPTPEEIKKLRPQMDAFLEDASVRKALEDHSAALAMPRFADACPLKLDAGCHELQSFTLHRAAMISALSAWGQGRWGDAVEQVTALLGADADAAATARSLVSNMIAITSLHASMHLAEALNAAAPSSPGPGDPARLAALLRAARATDPPALTLRRAVVIENIHGRQAIEFLLNDPSATGGQRASLLLFDVGRTAEELDQDTAALLLSLDDPSRAPPEPTDIAGIWWRYNPVGTLLVRSMKMSWGGQIARYAEKRTALLAARDRLVASRG